MRGREALQLELPLQKRRPWHLSMPLLLWRTCTKVAREGIWYSAATAAPEAMAST